MEDRVYLPTRQYAIIKVLAGTEGSVTAPELAEKLGKKQEDIMRDLAELGSKNLLTINKRMKYVVSLTDEGRKYLKEGLPEERLIQVLKELGGQSSISDLPRKSGLDKNEYAAAFGRLRRFGVINVSRGIVVLVPGKEGELRKYIDEVKTRLRQLEKGPYVSSELTGWIKELKRRNIVKVEQVKEIIIELTPLARKLMNEGKVREAEVITNLTSETISSGKWRNAIFKEFDLTVDVPIKYPRKKHPYIQFLNYVREVVISMGFEEVKGPHIETALWNFDVLFVPQYHPARRGTDVYYVDDGLSAKVPDEVLKKTKLVHERVWKYKWSAETALKLVLRTHTTPVSMRTIYGRGGGEYRAFSLDRVFRPDTPDPTHLMEFHQLEGIIVGKEVTFKHLLGFFKEFAKALGLGEVRFRPAYFPFTEPSVEGYIKHPKLGWIEVFPGGMFRPEVLEPVGLPKEYNVAAWGIGIDRIAMMVLGIDDIRNLYTNDLDVIKSTPVPREVIK